MKKVFVLASVICMFFGQAMAATVPVQTAQIVARNCYKGQVPGAGTVTPTLVYTRTEADQTVDYYIFDMAPARGFVIVAATDVVRPIMAYSTESNFNLNFQKTGVKDWTDHAAANVYRAIQLGLQADANINHLWTAYKTGPYAPPSRSGAIGPLTHTTWDQEPNYNQFCPFNTRDNQQTVTGCVATTMAQIMKYWNYPASGTGSNSYQCTSSDNYNYGTLSANFNHPYAWASMPNNLNGADTNVARLMYDCGVSVDMTYGDIVEDGSGAFVLQSEAWGGGPCAQKAYANNFKYNPATLQGVKYSSYNSSAPWFAILKAEIDAGRVIQYEGDDPTQGGHTWVMDGYDAGSNMHMNWGWGGLDDGYFTVSNLAADGANFNSNEAALIGIQPLFPYTVSIQAPATQICLGSATQLTAQGPVTGNYTWSPATGLDCATCAVTNAHPTVNTLYTVTCDSAGVSVPSSVLITVVPAVKANFSLPSTTACSTPATFTFNNTSSFASTFFWTFGDGTTSNDSAPSHTYTSYGIYDVSLKVSGQCGADSLYQPQFVGVNNTAPIASGMTICNGSSTSLNAIAAGDVNWYTSYQGGTPISSGSTFTTPALTASTTYYAESQILGPLVTAGMADNTIGTGSYYTGAALHGILFNCYTPQILSFVDVYSQNAGNLTVILSNSSGSTLQSTTVAVGQGGNTIPLNFNIPVGTGLEISASGSDAQLYRTHTGVVYPYFSQDSAIKMSSSDAGPGYYYFFYDWQLESPGCISDRVAVPVYVLNGSNSFHYSSATGNVVTFVPVISAGATYQWIFGDGTTSTDQSPVHTYSTAGQYTVKLVVSNGSCADTVSGVISAAAGANTTGIADLTVVNDMSVYPNPVRDMLELKVNSMQAATMQMSVYDVIGNVVSTRNVDLNIGTNNLSTDVASYASGVYTIVMTNGSSKATARFIKD